MLSLSKWCFPLRSVFLFWFCCEVLLRCGVFVLSPCCASFFRFLVSFVRGELPLKPRFIQFLLFFVYVCCVCVTFLVKFMTMSSYQFD